MVNPHDALLDAYIADHVSGWIDELARLCRQPSVSARHEGIEECAALVAELLRARGFAVTLSSVDGGHPVVLGHAPGANKERALLIL